nr:hypothetical protein [Pseudomonadota bacterium]
MKTCRECGEMFQPKAAYHHTCLPCWKLQRQSQQGEAVTLDDVLTAHERGRAQERAEWRETILRYDNWLREAYRERELA